MPDDAYEDERYQEAIQDAEADLTYTEAGFLTSYEWGIVFEDPTREQILEFLDGR